MVAIKSQNEEYLAESVGLHRKGIRYIVNIDKGQRTIFANKHIQQIGVDYFKILSGSQNGKYDPEEYMELKYLGWITGDNGNTTKTAKGEIAQSILERLMSPNALSVID